MKLGTSKVVLKVAGVFTVIGSVAALAAGSFLGSGAGANVEGLDTSALTGTTGGSAAGLGIIIAVAGLYWMVEGIVDLIAAKHFRFGAAAGVFAVVGLLASVFNYGADFMSNGFTVSSAVGLAMSAGINSLILTAANTVRKEHKNSLAAVR